MIIGLHDNYEIWTLRLEDRDFLSLKPIKAQLDLAIRILSYRTFGKFLEISYLDQNVVNYISEQMELKDAFCIVDDISERTDRLRSKIILEHLGITKGSAANRAKLKEALMKDSSIFVEYDEFESAVLKWSVAEKTLPPTTTWMGRVYSSRQSKLDDAAFRVETKALSKKQRQILLDSIAGKGEVISLNEMRAHPGRISKSNFDIAVRRVAFVTELELPTQVSNRGAGWQRRVRRRVDATKPSMLKQLKDYHQIGLYAVYLRGELPDLKDGIIRALCDGVKKFSTKAKRTVDREIARDAKQIKEREKILRDILSMAINEPTRQLGRTVSLRVGVDKAKRIIRAIDMAGSYEESILHEMKRSWRGYYRPMLSKLLETLNFQGDERARYLLAALEWIGSDYEGLEPLQSSKANRRFSFMSEKKERIITVSGQLDRVGYEVYTVMALQEALELRKIWVEGCRQYQDPSADLPTDFKLRRGYYYDQLKQPRDPKGFTAKLKRDMEKEVLMFNDTLPRNRSVFLTTDPKWRLSKYTPLEEPKNVSALKQQLFNRWENVPFIDILKETALDTGFLREFQSFVTRSALPRSVVNQRLILSLFALGTNVGLKAMAGASNLVTEEQLRHIKRVYIDKESLVEANQVVSNAILRIRDTEIWGEASTACASDSKQYAAWDQNPMAEMHLRYQGSGIMIYWHVENGAMCVFSNLKRVSASEVSSMIQGLLHHGLDLEIETNYTDSHGQTEVAFGFCHLLGFDLAPRIKRIAHQTIFLPDDKLLGRLGNIRAMCRRVIDWQLIEENYDQLIQYATALKEGTVDTETLLRLFRRGNGQNPNYRAVAELGRVIKTMFVCRYLRSERLRRDVQEGLNVMEHWNGATQFVHFGRGGKFTSNNVKDMEISMKALQLLQNSMVYLNTQMYQSVLSDPVWRNRMKAEDLKRLSPLINSHINILGEVDLNMDTRIGIL